MIRLERSEWSNILDKLKEEYAHKPSIFLIRDVMRRELGFTVRTHSDWSSRDGFINIVFLDFYDEVKETYFRLKYI